MNWIQYVIKMSVFSEVVWTNMQYRDCWGSSQWYVRFIVLFSFIGHLGVQHWDYELYPKQHFNILSKGWESAVVLFLNVLVMPERKTNNETFFSSKPIKKHLGWLFILSVEWRKRWYLLPIMQLCQLETLYLWVDLTCSFQSVKLNTVARHDGR